MANTFYIKQNDTSPILEQTLKDPNGDVVSLIGASANIHIFTRRGVSAVDTSVTISGDGSAGIIQYTFSGLAVGNYNYEIEVAFSDGSFETFPNVGYDLIIVEVDLA